MRSPLGSILQAISNRAPVPYAARRSYNNRLGTSRTGAEQQMAAMGSVGTLFSIVNRTSNSTSQVNWKLWRKAASGLKEDRTEVLVHPALSVWNKPNAFYTRQEFVESGQQHVDLTGEAWWVISRIGGRPIELWCVRPDRMEPVKSQTDFISGYIYTGPEGEKIPLSKEDVIQLKMPNPLDPYRGMGPVQAILTDLDSTRYSAEWNRNFFLNSAEPGGIVQVPEAWTDEQFDSFSARWREAHQGVANSHRVAILEGGATWAQNRYSQKDMQFVELRRANRDTILEAFGIPKSMLGIVEDVNRANAQTSKVVFAENLISPRLESIKGALNNDFLPMFGTTAQGLEFDYEDPVPQDAEARIAERDSAVAAYVSLLSAGVNEADAAQYCGLPSMRVTKPQPALAGGGSNDGGSDQLA